MKKNKDGSTQIITSKKYDFSNPNEIKKFDKDRKMLDNNFKEGVKSFGIVEPLSEDDHGGYIITGINAERIYGEYDNHFQLCGYWDWQPTAFVSAYDKVGLGWTNGFSSNENTQWAYGNRYYDGATITLNKIPYNTPRCFNKGVIWTHASNWKSYGSTNAQIYDNSLSNQYIGIWFEYAQTGTATADESWVVNVANMVFSYLGIPLPSITHYQSFEQLYCY